MALFFIDIQHLSYLQIQSRIHIFQSVRHIHVHGRLADSEFLCSRTDGCLVFDDIFTELNGSFFDNSFQNKTPLPFVCRCYFTADNTYLCRQRGKYSFLKRHQCADTVCNFLQPEDFLCIVEILRRAQRIFDFVELASESAQ